MATYTIEYAFTSPAVLASTVGHMFHCLCDWADVNEDYFSFTVIGCDDLDMLADWLAEVAGI